MAFSQYCILICLWWLNLQIIPSQFVYQILWCYCAETHLSLFFWLDYEYLRVYACVSASKKERCLSSYTFFWLNTTSWFWWILTNQKGKTRSCDFVRKRLGRSKQIFTKLKVPKYLEGINYFQKFWNKEPNKFITKFWGQYMWKCQI